MARLRPRLAPVKLCKDWTIPRWRSGCRRYAPWGIFRDGELIGHGGLNDVPEFGETEVLWALHPDFWGKGYATEVARAAMKRIGLTWRKRVKYKGFDAVWFDKSRD